MAFLVGDNAYCTVAEIASEFGGFTVPDAWTDAMKEDQIITETQHIDSLVRNHFGSTALTLEIDGSGTPFLSFLSDTEWSCTSITSVRHRGIFDADFDWANNGDTVSVDTYVLSKSGHGVDRVAGSSVRSEGMFDQVVHGHAPYGYHRHIQGVWARGMRNYQVIGAFGASEIPQIIKEVCILMVRDKITPGTSLKLEVLQQEKWPDGYALWRRDTSRVESIVVLTGNSVIDGMLHPFVDQSPGFDVIS